MITHKFRQVEIASSATPDLWVITDSSPIDKRATFGYTPPMNIHDSGYGTLFRNRTIFRQLIETFVDEPWVKELDFSQAEPIETTFIDEDYKQSESDLIYRIKLQDQEVYFYVPFGLLRRHAAC